jgi:TolC family type I secretion outer membrane protein
LITRRIVFLAIAVLLTLVEGTAGQTLEKSLVEAYLNNPTLDAERARLKATDERVPQALSGWRPVVNSVESVGKVRLKGNRKSLITDETSGNLTPRSVGVRIQQPLYRGGRTVAATRAAENTVRAGRARLASVEQSVLLDGATAFMNVYRDQAVLGLNIRNEQRLARQLQATRNRFQVGEVTRTDVSQAEARQARATADRVQAEGNLEASRASYHNVIGEVPGTLQRPNIPQELPTDADGAIKRASENNPDILAAFFDERASRDTIDEVRGGLLPSLSLNGVAQKAYERAYTGARVDTLGVIVNLDVPLYEAGLVYSRVREATQVAAEQHHMLDRARRNTQEAATQAWNALETARAEIRSLTKQVEANRVALEGVQREVEVGARTVLDVLDAEQELLDSEVNLARAERDEAVAVFQLKTALGELTAQQLNLPMQYYDPEAHYEEVRNKWFGTSSSGDIRPDSTGIAARGLPSKPRPEPKKLAGRSQAESSPASTIAEPASTIAEPASTIAEPAPTAEPPPLDQARASLAPEWVEPTNSGIEPRAGMPNACSSCSELQNPVSSSSMPRTKTTASKPEPMAASATTQKGRRHSSTNHPSSSLPPAQEATRLTRDLRAKINLEMKRIAQSLQNEVAVASARERVRRWEAD